MSITGNFARGVLCSGTTSSDFGLYSSIVMVGLGASCAQAHVPSKARRTVFILDNSVRCSSWDFGEPRQHVFNLFSYFLGQLRTVLGRQPVRRHRVTDRD